MGSSLNLVLPFHTIYDRYGNRKTTAKSGITADSQAIPLDGVASQTFAAATNRITTSGHEYDHAGNMTRGKAPDGSLQRFEYDEAGRVVHIKTDSGTVLEANTFAHSNERLIRESSGTRTYYAWGGSSVVAEYTETATNPIWAKSYIYAGTRLLSTITKNGSSEKLEYQHPDRLGTKLITDTTLNTAKEQATLPFGTEITAETQATSNQRFTSYDRSEHTGLDYAVNRTYNSGQSRFTTVDPMGMRSTSLTNPQSLNLFAYVHNNPIDLSDPVGLNAQGCPAEYSSCGGGFDVFNPGGSGFSGGGFDNGRIYEGLAGGTVAFLMAYQARLKNNHDANDARRAIRKYIESDMTDTKALKRFIGLMLSNPTLVYSGPVTFSFTILVAEQGRGENNLGNNLNRAAATEKARLESQGFLVHLANISTIDGFRNNLIYEPYRKKNAHTLGIIFFGHGSSTQIHIGSGSGADTNIDYNNIGTLVNELPDLQIVFLKSCWTGRLKNGIAQRLANQLDVTVIGATRGTIFSGRPDRITDRKFPPKKGPIYLIPDGGRYKLFFPR